MQHRSTLYEDYFQTMLCFKKCRWRSSLMISVILIFLGVDLPPEAATIVRTEESISLDLRDMSIRTVHERQFSSYSLTRNLFLSNNLIYSIHKDGFCGMNSLFMLDLSDNELQYIHPETFKCSPVLKKLYLKNNHMLASGINHAFLYSNSITYVDISYCNFKKFSNEMFSGMTSLKQVIAIGNEACPRTITQISIDHIYCGRHTPDHHSKHNDTISNQTSGRFEGRNNKSEIIQTTTTTTTTITTVISTKLENLVENDLHASVTPSGTLNVVSDETTFKDRTITSSKMDETEKIVSKHKNSDDCANKAEKDHHDEQNYWKYVIALIIACANVLLIINTLLLILLLRRRNSHISVGNGTFSDQRPKNFVNEDETLLQSEVNLLRHNEKGSLYIP